MAFTNKDVMDLRAKTGVGMMDCKKALTEADGDMEKAIELLREKGKATSEKRAGKARQDRHPDRPFEQERHGRPGAHDGIQLPPGRRAQRPADHRR